MILSKYGVRIFGLPILLLYMSAYAAEMIPIPDAFPAEEWKMSCENGAWPTAVSKTLELHEALNYAVRWGAIKAGQGRIEVQGTENFKERSAYHLFMELKTVGVTKALHAYDEITNTWIDQSSFLPLKYEKQTREGAYSRNEEVIFDVPCQRLNRIDRRLDKNISERKQARLPGPTLDILGYIFYLRTLPLEVGAQYELTLVSGNRLWPVTVHVKNKLQISTSAGWFNCFFIEPTLRGDASDLKLKQLQVWLTADDKKIPVRIRMEANVGHITADLINTERRPS